MEKVFIALGSNLGDRAVNCRKAVNLLSSTGEVKVVKESRLYETEPWGVLEQDTFINAVIEVATDLSPRELLGLLKSVELRMGRKETVRWGPRIIDLDILFYGDHIINEAGLKVPHPGVHERAFVLVPLSEIAPGFIHPVSKRSVAELAAGVDASGVKKMDRQD